jgi:hypothetical protein
VFLLVIAIHAMVIFLVIRATPTHQFNASTPADQITLLYLPAPRQLTPTQQRALPNNVTPVAPKAEQASPPVLLTPKQEPAPIIDWDKEAVLAAQNAIKPDGYRNLSGLSPAQLKWISDNGYVPEAPGVVWKRPVFDHTADGMPIIHLGDRCVMVPPLPIVYCKIGRAH